MDEYEQNEEMAEAISMAEQHIRIHTATSAMIPSFQVTRIIHFQFLSVSKAISKNAHETALANR